MKTPSLIHYFLVNLMCFSTISSSFEKVHFMALYRQKIGGLGWLLNDVGFSLNQV